MSCGSANESARLWTPAICQLSASGAEAEDLRRGVGGLGARRRVLRAQLEVVLGGGVVDAEPEQPRDDLGAEAAGTFEPGGPRALRELGAAFERPSAVTSRRVELRHRARAAREPVDVGGRPPVVVGRWWSVGVVTAVGSEVDVAGSVDVGPSLLLRGRWRDRSSVASVSGAFGRNVLTLVAPISPCATTVVICGVAQLGGFDAGRGRAVGDGSTTARGRSEVGERLPQRSSIDRTAARALAPMSVNPSRSRPSRTRPSAQRS